MLAGGVRGAHDAPMDTLSLGLRGIVLGLVSATLMIASCGQQVPAVIRVEGASCAQACQHGRDLHCPFAEPTPNGATCETWCEEGRTKHTGMDTSCVAGIVTCEQSSRCVR